jgi:hypothetical protein
MRVTDQGGRPPPPRKPGPAKARDVYVTFQIRFAFALLGTAAVLCAVAAVSGFESTTGRAMKHLLTGLTVLAIAALVHAARVAWRGRRR